MYKNIGSRASSVVKLAPLSQRITSSLSKNYTSPLKRNDRIDLEAEQKRIGALGKHMQLQTRII